MGIRLEKKMIKKLYKQQIPEDVVFNHILCHLLDDTVTRIRLSAVCRSWQAFIRNAPPLTPRILMFGLHEWVGASGTSYGSLPFIFDPITATTHRLSRPKESLLGTNTAGFHSSYLVYSPHRSTNLPPLLYNPFSGKAVLELPARCRYPDGTSKTINYIPLWIKAQLFSLDHSTNRGRYVAAVDQYAGNSVLISNTPSYDKDDGISHGKDNQNCSWVVSSPIDGDRVVIEDLIFYKNEIYCISSDGGRLFALDLHRHLRPDGLFSSCPTPRIVYTRGGDFNPRVRRMVSLSYYLVELCGELMVVVKYHRRRLRMIPKVEFKVHRLNLEKGKLELVEDLGDAMLFLGRGCSMSWPCSSARKDQFFCKNYIYFFDFSASNSIRLGKFLVGSKILEFHPTGSLPKTGYVPIWVSIPI